KGAIGTITPSPHRVSGLGEAALGETAKRRDATGFLGNGFQILDERLALIIGQQRANNALTARTTLEGVTGVRVPEQCGVHEKSPRRCRGVEPDLERIEVASEIKLLRALGRRYEHLI